MIPKSHPGNRFVFSERLSEIKFSYDQSSMSVDGLALARQGFFRLNILVSGCGFP